MSAVKIQGLSEVDLRSPEEMKKKWGGGLKESNPPKLPEDSKKSAEDAIDAVFGLQEKKKKVPPKKSKQEILSALSEDVKDLQGTLKKKKIKLSGLDDLEKKVESVKLRESSVDWNGVLKLVDEYTAEKITAYELLEGLPKFGWTF